MAPRNCLKGQHGHHMPLSPRPLPKTSTPFNRAGQEIYDWADDKGFHEPISAEVGEIATRLLLVISEICEAFEDIRKDDSEHHAEEIADTMIRLLHYAAHEGIDLDAEVQRKMEINRGRPRKHGKKF